MVKNDKQVVFTLVAAFLVIYIFTDVKILLYVALVITILSLLSSDFAFYLSFGWMKLGGFLGKITNTILLSVVFFLILIPIAIIKRTTTNREERKQSAFKDRNILIKPSDLENPW